MLIHSTIRSFLCDPAGAQTQNLQNRNLTLYSIELRGRRGYLRFPPKKISM